jgi:hypothetical protein
MRELVYPRGEQFQEHPMNPARPVLVLLLGLAAAARATKCGLCQVQASFRCANFGVMCFDGRCT